MNGRCKLRMMVFVWIEIVESIRTLKSTHTLRLLVPIRVISLLAEPSQRQPEIHAQGHFFFHLLYLADAVSVGDDFRPSSIGKRDVAGVREAESEREKDRLRITPEATGFRRISRFA